MSQPTRVRLESLLLAQTALGEWAKNRSAIDRLRLDVAAETMRDMAREEGDRLLALELENERPKSLLRSLWEGIRG